MTSLAIKLLLELFLLIQMYTIYIKEVIRRDFLGVLKTFLCKLGQNDDRVVEYIQKSLVFFFLSEYLEVSVNCLDETEGKIRSFYIFFPMEMMLIFWLSILMGRSSSVEHPGCLMIIKSRCLQII